ncbi:phosphatidylglycerol lysyltransferase domain-containing protein [Pseudooceanicola algae]|uniref:Phosphatidylglycerol lysyltransferase C-terminal domain-containing protein n=1 Tax=Pseudooceanicola algae TaxID=1537215 RepID=A0A418SE99_9RHOB|nr:phosphatidylglycerol lysyltransferase domain-containing protein [Pseudooceanicola algae]QPM89676.1 hypothetical protein PSAL_009010 [Pseudooceanicola algae]
MTMANDAPPRRRNGWMRLGLPLVVGGICIWLLAGRLSALDPETLWQAFREVTAAQWAGSFAATALSFWALGRYDAVMHRHLRTGVSDAEAQASGASAIALGQVLGLGIVTGTVARWKLLPQIGTLKAAQVTAAVSVSFLMAWAVVTGLSGLILAPALIPKGLAVLSLAVGLTLPACSLLLPELRLGWWRFRFPSIQAMLAIAFFAMIDTFSAAIAFHILLPEGVSFGTLLPCFLLALGAGLFAGTPGGVGPFELTLLALLPQIPGSELMAAVLAFRLVYYAIPAFIAVTYASFQILQRRRSTLFDIPRRHVPRSIPELLLDLAPRSESGLARQNGARLLGASHCAGLVIDTPQSLTLLFDPLTGGLGPLLPRLACAARSSNRMALVYKCTAAPALEARRAGWNVLRIADEAVIQPGELTLEGSRYRQLRRKLRNAEKAGITVTRPDTMPVETMAALDRIWVREHGQARGLSTGRYDPDYVAHQRLYCAWENNALVAYVTFHENRHELCLDLMRHGLGLPDGTMHKLIVAAARDGAKEGRALSLAAMPARDLREAPLLARLRQYVARRSGGEGLIRFKDSFSPRRVPLYMAAPGRLQLILGAADLALAMRRPAPRAPTLSTPARSAYERDGAAAPAARR